MKKSNKSKEVLRLEQVVSEILGVPKKYNDTNANGLTICIIDFLQIVKHQQAERFHSGGVPFIDNSGNQRFAKPKTTTGTSDIHATIKGRSVKIEVKIFDVQSENQKKYQKSIEMAGGIYFITTSFREFAWWYNKTFEK